VRRVDNPSQLRAAYTSAASAALMGITALPGVLVEEYLPGPEVSAECVVFASGETRIAAVARKILGDEPQFEEVGHTVAARDALLRDPVLQYVAAHAVAALGLSSCVLHLDIRLTANGPAVVGVNCRLGGDLVPHLIDLASGISLPRAAALLASGAVPDLLPQRSAAAAIGFTYPQAAGVVERLYSPGEPAAPWLERAVWTASPGDAVTPPSLGGGLASRLGHHVVTGPDYATCRHRLDLVAASVAVRIRPAVHAPACVI
jgi:biotin carboxylase